MYRFNHYNNWYSKCRTIYIITMIFCCTLKQSLCSGCTGDLFPTVFNCDFKELITSENNKLENPNNLPDLNSTYNDPFQIYYYKTSPGESLEPVTTFLIENEDLLYLLTDTIKNRPIMRTDRDAKVKWIKLYQILMNGGFICYYDKKIDVKNDVIFALDICFDGYDYSNVFTKISTNGTFIGKFNSDSKINSVFSTSYNIYSILDMKIADENSIFLSGTTKYMNGNLGVSLSSGTDTILIKVDNNFINQWIISADINNYTDSFISAIVDDSSAYCFSLNLKGVTCISKLNFTNGEYLNSQCYQHYNTTKQNMKLNTNDRIDIVQMYKDTIVIFYSFSKMSHGRLVFLSKTNYDIKKVFLTGYKKIPTLYGLAEQADTLILFYPVSKVSFRIELDRGSLEIISNKGLYRVNSTYTPYDGVNILIANPMNASDCNTNDSCYVKYIGSVLIYSSTSYASTIVTEKFNFNFDETSCDSPIDYYSQTKYKVTSIYNETDYGGNALGKVDASFQIRITNYTMFISEMGYFTVSELDLDNKIWPILEGSSAGSCLLDLPKYELSSNAGLIHIGKRADLISQQFKYSPFSHCRNSKFSFIICDDSYIKDGNCNQPNWVSINSTENSFSILLDQITSSGLKHIKLQATLIQISLVNTTDGLSTDIIDVYFNFINSNIELINYDPNPYIVFNQAKTFNFTLSDNENDELFIKIVDPGLLNLFVQRLPSNNQFQLIAISLDTSNSNQTVVLQYTDSYHQEPSEWKNLTLSVAVYPTEPPKFAESLKDVLISACDQINIQIPEVEDSDSEEFWIELDPSTPSWITLINNKTLSVDALNANLTRMKTSQIVTFKLSDDSGAVVFPKMKLLIDTSMLIEFKHFNNIEIIYSQMTFIDIEFGSNNDMKLVSCENNELIKWSLYNQTSKMLILYAHDANFIGEHCAKLITFDGCGKSISSNMFYIFVKVKNPPTILGNLDSISLMKGEKRVYQYSKTLIYDEDISKLVFNYTLFSKNKKANPAFLNLTEDIFNLYVYVEGKEVGEFTMMLHINDEVGNSCETPIGISIFSCASKDCRECKGNTQADCTLCIKNHYLEERTGRCLQIYVYWEIVNSIYAIFGIIMFVIIIVNMLLIFKLKRISLFPLSYAQIILIFLLSAKDINDETIEFTTFIANFNSSLDFLSFGQLNYYFDCNTTKKMQAMHLYCNSTFLNFKILIFIVSMILLLFYPLKLLLKNLQKHEKFNEFISKIYLTRIFSKVRISKFDVCCTILHCIVPFLTINLISDILNFEIHYIYGSAAVLFVIIVLVLLIIKKLKFIKSEFIKQMDPINPYFYSYLYFGRTIIHSCLFLFGDSTNYHAWCGAAITIHVLMLMVQSSEFLFERFKIELTLIQRKEKNLSILGESCVLIIISCIWVSNIGEARISKAIYFLIVVCFIAYTFTSFVFMNGKSKANLENDK